jgi:beta-mannanase
MNIESYPWSTDRGNTNPQAYREMWQHVWQILRDYGLDEQTVQWVWCVNFTDGKGSPAEAFYPGDDYVDWMAVDGYNWGRSETWSTWQTPAEVFEPMISRLQALSGKPIAITEVGTSAVTEDGIDPARKSAWIADFFRRVPRWNVKMVAWFNADKAHEWAVFNGQVGDSTFVHDRNSYRGFVSYRTALDQDMFLSSDSTHPRLLTDLQFSGH